MPFESATAAPDDVRDGGKGRRIGGASSEYHNSGLNDNPRAVDFDDVTELLYGPSPMLAAALELAGRGLKVFPILYRGEKRDEWTPIMGWQGIATADPEMIRRLYARTNSIRLWQSRTCATFTVTVTPAISTISWLQSNWYASPGAKLSGTKAAAVAAVRSRCHAAAYRRTASWPPS